MTSQQLQTFQSWFSRYVSKFYADDAHVNAHLELKEKHSYRVCGEMRRLARELNLAEDDRRIARAVALFHDVGRFPQFVRYGTYNDTRSTNHCRLGVEVLRSAGILNDLPDNEREIIEKAVEVHGIKTVPPDIAEPTLRFCKLIRDADKLDVYRVAIRYLADYKNAPKSLMLELEFADEPTCTPEVIDAVLAEECVDYSRLQTVNDMLLCQLGWVYDINFAPSFRRVKEKGYLRTLIGYLPQTPEVARARDKVLAYVDARAR